MDRYQLVKLVEWAGELRSRKRLQKVVYLLQAAGAPIEAEFTLHHYGPYSFDVAQLTDSMVREGLLKEDKRPNTHQGESFSYKIPVEIRDNLAEYEGNESGAILKAQAHTYEPKARILLAEDDLSKLEFAATVAYFHVQGNDWKAAREAAAKFKGQPPESLAMIDATEFARLIIGAEDQG